MSHFSESELNAIERQILNCEMARSGVVTLDPRAARWMYDWAVSGGDDEAIETLEAEVEGLEETIADLREDLADAEEKLLAKVA